MMDGNTIVVHAGISRLYTRSAEMTQSIVVLPYFSSLAHMQVTLAETSTQVILQSRKNPQEISNDKALLVGCADDHYDCDAGPARHIHVRICACSSSLASTLPEKCFPDSLTNFSKLSTLLPLNYLVLFVLQFSTFFHVLLKGIKD